MLYIFIIFNFKFSGVLNPLDSPHHMRATDKAMYREGVVVKKHSKEGKGSYVNVGIMKVCIPCCQAKIVFFGCIFMPPSKKWGYIALHLPVGRLVSRSIDKSCPIVN